METLMIKNLKLLVKVGLVGVFKAKQRVRKRKRSHDSKLEQRKEKEEMNQLLRMMIQIKKVAVTKHKLQKLSN